VSSFRLPVLEWGVSSVTRKGHAMRMRLLCFLLLPVLALSFSGWRGLATQPGGKDADKAAIKKQAEAFVEAFHKGDAKAVAAFWLRMATTWTRQAWN
jgi:hypothetical protein